MIKPVSGLNVRKFALGAMLLGATVAGISSCSNKSKYENDIRYERNINLAERDSIGNLNTNVRIYRWDDNLFTSKTDKIYSAYGLYGGSIVQQRYLNRRLVTDTRNFQDILDNYGQYTNSRDRKDRWDVWKWIYSESGLKQKYNRYFDETSARDEEKLFSKGTPTAKECSNYLELTISSDFNVSPESYKKYIQDCKNFEKTLDLNTPQGQAEMIAYKQFKRDSMAYRRLFQEEGMMRDENFRTRFERTYFPPMGKPKPSPSFLQKARNWFDKTMDAIF